MNDKADEAPPESKSIFRENIERDIADTINRWSAENGSNTPDFILATFLVDSLAAFDKATIARDKWQGNSSHQGSLDRLNEKNHAA